MDEQTRVAHEREERIVSLDRRFAVVPARRHAILCYWTSTSGSTFDFMAGSLPAAAHSHPHP